MTSVQTGGEREFGCTCARKKGEEEIPLSILRTSHTLPSLLNTCYIG